MALAVTGAVERVIAIAHNATGIKLEQLTASTAIDQDMRIAGDDVVELCWALEDEFGGWVREWPWSRFADLNEPHLLVAPYLVWRLLTWPFRGRLFDASPYERLELGHIAAVIDKGEWFEP